MTMSSCALTVILLLVLLPLGVVAQEPPRPPASPSPAPTATASPSPTPTPEASPTPRDPLSTPTFNGLRLRSIGPAFTSGRVIGFAVDPTNASRYYVAVASGGVWKTVNAGITWTPVFDAEASYSIGCIVLDPKNPLVVWVGTGENNSQRSVSYGNGVYKSEDGGRSWKNVGLKTSEHIGRIAIDPKDSNIVYVAAQGPLWGSGGERGLFKTADGGKTWKNILNISENTGVTDVVIDPNDPNTIYCASYQRRRHYYTLINGGPESAVYKSTDAGATWNKLRTGLPTVELGRIGLAISPADSNVIYATVEAADRKGGIFRSADRGGSWERRNEYDTTAMYYARIVADPKDVERVYVMNVFLMSQTTAAVHCAVSARRTSTSTITRSGSIRRIRIIISSVATVAFTRVTIAARTGTSNKIFRYRSFTTSRPTTRSRSTTSTAAPRTTSVSVGHHARAVLQALSMPIGL